MPVRDIMTADVECLDCNDTIQSAAQKMAELNIGSLPVRDGGELVGIVTDRDLAIRAVAEGMAVDTPVAQVMTEGLHTISADASSEDANRVMSAEQIRRLYVVDNDALVGVVSLGDLALERSADEAGDALREISRS